MVPIRIFERCSLASSDNNDRQILWISQHPRISTSIHYGINLLYLDPQFVHLSVNEDNFCWFHIAAGHIQHGLLIFNCKEGRGSSIWLSRLSRLLRGSRQGSRQHNFDIISVIIYSQSWIAGFDLNKRVLWAFLVLIKQMFHGTSWRIFSDISLNTNLLAGWLEVS